MNECKEKWRNLRSTFVRHLKPKPSGTGATKRPYYLMDAMQFAVPFVKVLGNLTGNLPEASQTTLSFTTSTADDDETDNPEEENQDITEEMLCKPEVCSPFAPFPAISMPPSANQGDRVATPPSEATIGTRGPHGQPIRRRKFVDSDASDKVFTAYFSEKQAKLSNPLPPKDVGDRREEAIKNFLMSLIPDLMQLNDVQLRSYKRRALLLIDEVGGSSTDLPQSSLNVPMGGNFSGLNRLEKTTPQEHSHSTENCTTVHQSL
ncbi:uncharacterized protein LOC143208241 isoform X2 [Lasioglossum baleicum]|uniref:uncharacterized protein LOC143208241 isoform X2 n=1 Tax=Lasioglossum baleicum TaxID=434251 RepID=UPI003FCE2722